ncbi:DUF6153 family protein [Streptomyces luteireticuli]|uniref:DUF6153 family protein n=1 Tax=Streptomyces luteireticuli TaxID=173858 RepID=UPI003557E04C
MRGRGKADGTWCGRLLLFAALLLGIVTMHTLGHPTGHDAPTSPGHPAHSAHSARSVQAQAHPGTPDGDRAAPPPHHRPGLDPMSVCLAVLGAGWTVVLLLALRFLRRPAGAAVAAAVRARFAHALWPIPPPPRHKALARLSVLRV